MVEQGTLRSLQVRGPFAPHRDVHEARLIDVLAGGVNELDLDLASADPGTQLLDE